MGTLAHPYALAHMSALTLAPPAFIAVAAKAGFDMVGLRLQDTTAGALAYPLMDQPGMLRETLAQLQHTGLDVFDIEVVHLDAAFQVQQCLGLLGVGAELDARAVKVVCHDSDAARLADSLALLCEAAGRFGMSANIAFMPGSAVADLAAAAALLASAGAPAHVGILVDALHVAHSVSTLEQLAALPREWLHLATLCDAAHLPRALANMPCQAQAERLLPGEGSLDLAGLLRALPGDLPLSVGVWDERRAQAIGPAEWAHCALEAAIDVVTRSSPAYPHKTKKIDFPSSTT